MRSPAGPRWPSCPIRVRTAGDSGDARVFFVVPWGGGSELEVAGTIVTVITPASPVGRALVGRRAGDDFELAVRGAMREWEIDEIV